MRRFTSITRANHHHPESFLVLQLFLHANYAWHLARKIQNKPSSIDSIDWALYEKNTAKLLNQSLSKLLAGISTEPWKPDIGEPVPEAKPAKKSRVAARQNCGCSHKHSQAAGVVDACELGKAQGQDESWTGH